MAHAAWPMPNRFQKVDTRSFFNSYENYCPLVSAYIFIELVTRRAVFDEKNFSVSWTSYDVTGSDLYTVVGQNMTYFCSAQKLKNMSPFGRFFDGYFLTKILILGIFGNILT